MPVAIALLAAGCSGPTSQQSVQPTPTANRNKAATPAVPPPNPSVNILAQAAKAVDSQGNALNPASTFSTKDQKIYIVVKLKNAKKNDVVSIVRYYKGKFLKANSLRVASDKLQNAVFKFSKPTGYPKGDYLVKVFYNNKALTSVAYTVQ